MVSSSQICPTSADLVVMNWSTVPLHAQWDRCTKLTYFVVQCSGTRSVPVQHRRCIRNVYMVYVLFCMVFLLCFLLFQCGLCLFSGIPWTQLNSFAKRLSFDEQFLAGFQPIPVLLHICFFLATSASVSACGPVGPYATRRREYAASSLSGHTVTHSIHMHRTQSWVFNFLPRALFWSLW